jgi:molecular chaperone DnaK
VQASDKGDVESALADAKKVLENTSASAKEMRDAYEKLTQSSHKLAEAMYKASAAQTGAAGGPSAQADGSGASAGEQKKEGEVIDAEYVDVDEKK